MPDITDQATRCNTLAAGNVQATDNAGYVEYRYEATVSGDVATVNSAMDSRTTLLAGNTLMECNGRRALLFEIALQKNLDERGLEEECVVVGMDSDPVDTVTEDPCDPPADDCVVIVGKMRTYTSGPGCVEQSENDALTAIMGGMNDDGTFLFDSGTKYAVAGLTGTKFLTGTNPLTTRWQFHPRTKRII